MTRTVVVYEIREGNREFRWRLPDELTGADLREFVQRDPAPSLSLHTSAQLEDQPTFSFIDGLSGAFVAKIDEAATPGVEFFARFETETVTLHGQAEGSLLVVPTIGKTLDEATCNQCDQEDPSTWPFNPDLLGSGFFVVIPFASVLLCSQWIMQGAERIIDLERNSEMEFPDWLELTGASGFELHEVWRHARDDAAFDRPPSGLSFELPALEERERIRRQSR